jgi:hypothetical protein
MNFAIHWYINGSHQIHKDCRGQTGSLVIFGAGSVSSSSNKQKSNTKSSTETEIIALHDKLSDVIWMRYFVECQGYTIDECIIFQDNMSTLSLEKNSRMSSSKCTKHIKAKYFLIQDYYDAGEVMFWQNHFKVSCSGICKHSYKTARETMMMTWSNRKTNEHTIW